jgi:hypothetical protein
MRWSVIDDSEMLGMRMWYEEEEKRREEEEGRRGRRAGKAGTELSNVFMTGVALAERSNTSNSTSSSGRTSSGGSCSFSSKATSGCGRCVSGNGEVCAQRPCALCL